MSTPIKIFKNTKIFLLCFYFTGDSMLDTAYTGFSNRNLSGMQFSTKDNDNDPNNVVNCGERFKGGWWFKSCFHAFLNGPWSPANWTWPWNPTILSGIDVKQTAMMIKTV
jgi:hypothetical protein